MDLNVPVIHDGDIFHKEIKEIRVDYSTDWVRRTEYAVESAYFNSPFFEFYRDGLFSILDAHPALLWDLDLSVIEFFCRKIGLSTSLIETTEYFGADVEIHPKKASAYIARPYWQVFRERFGFTPGLSVMDLLFNEGPESLPYLL